MSVPMTLSDIERRDMSLEGHFFQVDFITRVQFDLERPNLAG